MFFRDNGGGCDDCYTIRPNVYFRGNKDTISTLYYLRNKNSQVAIKKLMVESNKNLYNFRITSEIDTILITRGNVKQKNNEPNYSEFESEKNEMWSVYSNFYYGFPECLMPESFYFSSNGEYFLYINEILKQQSKSDIGKKYESKLNDSEDIYIKKTQNINPVKFSYSHILPLLKLEKISKYKIESWKNKLN